MTEEEIRDDERHKCWAEINRWIVPGPLPGNGWDRTAQRNGMILAANQLAAMIKHWPEPADGG